MVDFGRLSFLESLPVLYHLFIGSSETNYSYSSRVLTKELTNIINLYAAVADCVYTTHARILEASILLQLLLGHD